MSNLMNKKGIVALAHINEVTKAETTSNAQSCF
jgi:hypothetical protein